MIDKILDTASREISAFLSNNPKMYSASMREEIIKVGIRMDIIRRSLDADLVEYSHIFQQTKVKLLFD